jgi:hypothetical protein
LPSAFAAGRGPPSAATDRLSAASEEELLMWRDPFVPDRLSDHEPLSMPLGERPGRPLTG